MANKDEVDSLFEALARGQAPKQDAEDPADKAFADLASRTGAAPRPPARAPLKQGESQFRPGPAHDGRSVPMIHGAAGGVSRDPEAGGVPSKPKEGISGLGATAVGAGQGMTWGYQDEIEGVGGALGLGTTEKTPFQKQASEDLNPDGVGFKNWVMDRYGRTRDSSRKIRDMAAEQKPAQYASGHLAGTAATTAALATLTGGASLTPPAAGLEGFAAGLGSSDAPLGSEESNEAAVNSALLSSATAGLGNAAPLKTAAAAGVAGLGAAAFGDKVGMTPAERIEAGMGGGLALTAAGSGAVAKSAGAINKSARGKIQNRLTEQDALAGAKMDKENASSLKEGLKKFDALAKQIDEGGSNKTTAHREVAPGVHAPEDPIKFVKSETDALVAKEKPYFDAEQKFGKEKAKKFKKGLVGKQKDRAAAEDASFAERKVETEGTANQIDSDWGERMRETEALSRQQKPVATAGTSPDKLAEFEASIPARVKGKQDADYQAVLNRYDTMKSLGHEIPAELQSRVNAIRERYAKNSPEFFDRFLYDWEGNAAKYQAELEGELAGMRAGRRSSTNPDTAITPAKRPDTVIRSRDAEHASERAGKLKSAGANDADDVRGELDIPREPGPGGDSFKYPEAVAHKQSLADAKNKAIDKMLGLAELEPGEKPDYSVLLSPDEKGSIAGHVGVNPHADPPPAPVAKYRNSAEVKAHGYGPDNGPPTIASGDRVSKGGAKSAPHDDSFYRGPEPEKDFADSPLSNADWKKVAGAHVKDEDLSLDLRADMLREKLPFTDSTSALDDAPAAPHGTEKFDLPDPMAARVDAEVAKGRINKPDLSMLKGGVFSKALGMGADYATDPAVAAKMFGPVERAFSKHPDLYKKYAPFIQQGMSEGVNGLVSRVQFLLSSDPAFALAVSEPEPTSR